MPASNQIFIDFQKFLPDFIPPTLLHRRDEIKALALNFRELFSGRRAKIRSLEGKSTNVVILGAPGNGKTALVKYTIDHIIKDAQKNNLNIFSSYTNGWQYRSFSGVLSSVFKNLEIPNAASKGFSLEEQVSNILMPYLSAKDGHLILTLDEINALTRDDLNSLFSLTEEYGERSRISLVLVSRPTEWHMLSSEANLRLNETIILHPYSYEQLREIIDYRASLALHSSAYDEEIINLVTEITFQDHNVRFALEILYRAGLLVKADQDSPFIEPEYIREAKSLVFPELRSEVLEELKNHELLALLGIARRLVNHKFTTVNLKDAFRYYRIACSERGDEYKQETTFRGYLNTLKLLGLINVVVSPTGRGKRGIKARISISDVPASIVIERVEVEIERIELL